MVKQRRQYTTALKVEAVRLIVEEGRRISEVARELGIGENLLGRWKNADINIELIQYRYGIPRIVKFRILFA